RCDAVVIDCLTLWLANMLGEEGTSEEAVLEGVRSMLEASREAGCTVVVVSNEVGGGIVPENALARLYRDVMGSANQMVAEAAE
ncbi:MAG: cobyric acid synthase CobQ, partial [Gemmatimonadales bacterium]|nr:cobyric acid synthase CobQ [Gemmatimonadales bacterium]